MRLVPGCGLHRRLGLVLVQRGIQAFDGLQLQWLYDKNVDMAGGLAELVEVLLAPARP